MKEIDDRTFESEVLSQKGTVLVDFSATWCGPCKMLTPVLEAVAAEGHAKVVKIDIDESPETAKRYGVRGVPTMIVFKDGEKRATHVGVTNKAKVIELIST